MNACDIALSEDVFHVISVYPMAKVEVSVPYTAGPEASEALDLRSDEVAKARILSSMGAACAAAGSVEEGLSHMKRAWQVARPMPCLTREAQLLANISESSESAALLGQMGSLHYQLALYDQAPASK